MWAKIQRPFTLAATLIGISIGMTSTVSASNYDRVDRIAVRIQKRSQDLIKETAQYRYTPVYGQLVQESRLLRDTAIHIHDVTHFEGNLFQLKRDITQIDQTFCNLDLLLKSIEIEAGRRHSRIDVNTRRARNLLNQIEREIHNLSDELIKISKLAYKPRPQSYRKPVPKPVVKSKAYSSYKKPYNNGKYVAKNVKPYKANRPSPGFSIGGGSTRIRIGF